MCTKAESIYKHMLHMRFGFHAALGLNSFFVNSIQTFAKPLYVTYNIQKG